MLAELFNKHGTDEDYPVNIHLLGIPLTLGGANQEAGDTALLWRRMGLGVTVVELRDCVCGKQLELWKQANPWRERLEQAGCSFISVDYGNTELLRNQIGVAFCHQHVVHLWPHLSKLGMKLIWSPCMTWTTRHERDVFSLCPPTAVHFQSRFQEELLGPTYTKWGCEVHRRIPGAFEPLSYRPLSRNPGDPFVVCRIARPVRTKWSPYIWTILSEVRRTGVDVRALCLGWTKELEATCGSPPEWATCLSPDSLSTRTVLSSSHAMICPNFGIRENWPRVGLEAMSAGVPVVADRAGGWLEMIDDGTTGLLCNSVQSYIKSLLFLANNEPSRIVLAEHGIESLKRIANQATIADEWELLFCASQSSQRAS